MTQTSLFCAVIIINIHILFRPYVLTLGLRNVFTVSEKLQDITERAQL